MSRLSPQHARTIFNAIGRSGAAIAALGVAAQLDEKGELSDEVLVAAVEDYLSAQFNLENARNTLGAIG